MPADIARAYDDAVASGTLRHDPDQALAIAALDRVAADLNAAPAPKRRGGLLAGLRRQTQAPQVRGLYLWGGVGRGKSMLMDLFFDTVPNVTKRRVHFHAFMQEIHDGLQQGRAEGLTDPLEPVAQKVAGAARLLCFDELQITDITDAMIVGRLFDKLFAAGVVVVTTSNRPPEDLYKDGLNRKLFLPFIDLIRERLEVLHLESPTDHRRLALADRPLYFSPLDDATRAAMGTLWQDLAGDEGAPLVLHNKGREVVLPKVSRGVARADFADLFQVPLGPSDYLLIAEAVAFLMIDDMPVLDRRRNNEAKRFVTLIDAFYEARKRVAIAADAPVEQLYVDGPGAFEFERTVSRLIEMRSDAYESEAEAAE